MSMVKPEFCFFEMQGKCVFCDPMKLSQSMLGVTPKRLNTVDML